MKKILLAGILLIIATGAKAETYSARLLNKQTNEPVAYANVGIAEKSTGAISDDNGFFKLELSAAQDRDSLTLSMIGYESRKIKVTDFKHLSAAKEPVYLVPKKRHLNEVVITPKTLHHRHLGNTANNKHTIFGFDQYRPGYEVGTHIKIKKSPTYIDSIRINVAKCEYDSVFLRVNIYEEVQGRMENILTEPIYISTDTATAMKNISVDLTHKNIVVKHDFILSVELVKDLGGKEMYFCAQIAGRGGYMRLTSQDKWRKIMMVGPSLSAYVTY